MEKSFKQRKRIYRIAALISYALGFYYVRFAAIGAALAAGRWYRILVFNLLFIAAVELFARSLGKPPAKLQGESTMRRESRLLAACSILQVIAVMLYGCHSGADGVWSGSGIEIWQILFWHFTLVYYVLARTGMLSEGRTGILFFLDAAAGLVYLPWADIFLRIRSVFGRGIREEEKEDAGDRAPHSADMAPENPGHGKEHGKEPGTGEAKETEEAKAQHRHRTALVLATAALAVLVSAIAWSQLAGVTASFAGIGASVGAFFRRIFAGDFLNLFLDEFLPYFVLSIPVSAWLFGLVGGSLERKEPPCTARHFAEATAGCHVLPAGSWYVVIGVLLGVYLLFFVVSAGELSWMFRAAGGGIAAAEAGAAAVQGFWQLVRVVILNFALLLASCLLADVPLWEKRATRALVSLMMVSTLLFGFLAFWKLFVLYIGLFGPTPRRILSGWVLCVLIFWTVLALIRFRRKIPAARIGILAAAVSFSLLMLLPMTEGRTGAGRPWRSAQTGADLSGGEEISYEDTHGGFHGDGYSLSVVRYADDSKEKSMEQAPDWQPLPLAKSLETFVYQPWDERIAIPKIRNGWYYFCDRSEEAENPFDASRLLERYSLNFTLGIYDSDTDTLYWLEYDT